MLALPFANKSDGLLVLEGGPDDHGDPHIHKIVWRKDGVGNQ
jgi:hypothetical protein